MMNAVELVDLIERYEYVADRQISSLRKQISSKNKKVSPQQVITLLLDKNHITKYQAKRLLDLVKGKIKERPIGKSDGAWTNKPDAEEIVDIDAGDLVQVEELDALDDLGGFDQMDTFDSPGALDSGFGEDAVEEKKKPKYKQKSTRANPWDSPLLLLGGGGLVLLVLLFGLLVMWLQWDSGDDQFQLAQQDYQNQSYVQAIAKYEKFLNNFPDHPSADLANVRLGMAKLRRDSDGTSNWEKALETANTILPEIENFETFEEARPELASLLPDIVQGFAENAKMATVKKNDDAQKNVDNARLALKLVDNPSYIPTSQRQAQQARIETIIAEIDQVERSISRKEELRLAIEEIVASSDNGDFEGVYARRKELLQIYPALELDKELSAAVADASSKLIDQIQHTKEVLTAEATDHESKSQHVTFVSRLAAKSKVSLGADQSVVVRFEGSLYAIELATGKLLWRRHVGFPDDKQPLRVTSADGSRAVITFDSNQNELLRLHAETGKLQWRLPLGEAIHQPLLVDDGVIVSSPSGKMWRVDATSGESDYQTTLPQNLSAAAGNTSGQPLVFVPGRHSNLYAISVDDLSCKEIVHVGHEPGTVTVPPIALLRHLLVFENAENDYAWMHVWKINDQGKLERAQESIQLPGRILVAPEVSESQIIITNNHGAIFVYKVDLGSKTEPLSEAVNPIKADREDGLYSYFKFNRGTLWVADHQLTKYDMQLAKGTLIRRSVNYQGSIFAGPMQTFGDLLILIHQQEGKPGAVVSAIRSNPKSIEKLWESHISIPIAGPVIPSDKGDSQVAVTARGDWFSLNEQSLGNPVADQIIDPSRRTIAEFNYPNQITLNNGNRLFSANQNGNEAAVYDSSNTTNLVQPVGWEIPKGTQIAAPTALKDLILVPCKTGQIFCLNPLTGAMAAHPFQPPLGVDSEIHWGQPVVFGDEGTSVIVSDGGTKLYHLELETTDESAALTLRQEVVLEHGISQTLAISGLSMAAVHPAGFEDKLLIFQLPELEVQKTIDLEGRVYLGPMVSNNLFLIATDKEGIVAVDDTSEVAWTLDTQGAELTGPPLADNGTLVFSLINGEVIKVDALTGDVIDSVNVSEPLVAGITKFKNQIIVNGYDGTLHAVQLK